MKIFVISDTHLGVRSNSIEWIDIQRSFFFDWFIDDVKTRIRPGDEIFHLGDVFDSRQSINLKVLNLGMEIFEALSRVAPVRVILGNHDCHDLNSNSINSVKPLGWLPNVTVYEEPEMIELEGKKMLMMPWRAKSEQEKKCLEEFKQADYLFCHTDVKGADFNKWTKVDHGNEVKEFSTYSKVYTGHIHYRQKVGNINFVGCPYELTRSDTGNHKGYWIIDTDLGTEEFVENPISPKFVRLNLDRVLETRLEDLREICKNNFVDIYMDEREAVNFPFQDLEESLEGFHRKLSFKTNFTSLPAVKQDETGIANGYDLDLISLTERFIDHLSHEDKLKEALKKYTRSLHNRVVEIKGIEK
jgi:DNA repair exonuclease SbcCD nuclease subunit